MNRLEGTIVAVKGTGSIRLVSVDTAAGRMHALVLDTGSAQRLYAPGGHVWVLFKETAVVVLGSDEPSIPGRVVELSKGLVLTEILVEFDLGPDRVRANLPSEELPTGLVMGDKIRLRVPASAVALELS